MLTLLIVLLVIIALVPTGYGWGYRGWGPPVPTWYARRRATAGAPYVAGYGWSADLVWLALVALLIVFLLRIF